MLVSLAPPVYFWWLASAQFCLWCVCISSHVFCSRVMHCCQIWIFLQHNRLLLCIIELRMERERFHFCWWLNKPDDHHDVCSLVIPIHLDTAFLKDCSPAERETKDFKTRNFVVKIYVGKWSIEDRRGSNLLKSWNSS